MRWLSSSLENPRVDLARVGFVATVALAGASFWISPLLPMIDLAQHAGQVTLWRDLLLDDEVTIFVREPPLAPRRKSD